DRSDDAAVEARAFFERPARCLNGAAFDLIARAVRTDDQPAVDCAPDLFDPHRLVDLHLRDHGSVAGLVLVARDAHSARRAPAPPAPRAAPPGPAEPGAGRPAPRPAGRPDEE